MTSFPSGYYVLFGLGLFMVLSGVGVFTYWLRRHWLRNRRAGKKVAGFGEFMVANAFFHFGMFLLVFGGIGIIYLSMYGRQ